jgi:hypothetical protein
MRMRRTLAILALTAALAGCGGQAATPATTSPASPAAQLAADQRAVDPIAQQFAAQLSAMQAYCTNSPAALAQLTEQTAQQLTAAGYPKAPAVILGAVDQAVGNYTTRQDCAPAFRFYVAMEQQYAGGW